MYGAHGCAPASVPATFLVTQESRSGLSAGNFFNHERRDMPNHFKIVLSPQCRLKHLPELREIGIEAMTAVFGRADAIIIERPDVDGTFDREWFAAAVHGSYSRERSTGVFFRERRTGVDLGSGAREWCKGVVHGSGAREWKEYGPRPDLFLCRRFFVTRPSLPGLGATPIGLSM